MLIYCSIGDLFTLSHLQGIKRDCSFRWSNRRIWVDDALLGCVNILRPVFEHFKTITSIPYDYRITTRRYVQEERCSYSQNKYKSCFLLALSFAVVLSMSPKTLPVLQRQSFFHPSLTFSRKKNLDTARTQCITFESSWL